VPKITEKTVSATVIIKAKKEITSEEILNLEILLNGDIATKVWKEAGLNVRFHFHIEE